MNRFYGKYRGIVTDNQDPEMSGRIKANVPDVFGEKESGWSLPCMLFSNRGEGFYAIPAIGDGVWIEFEQGDPDSPIWSGCWYDSMKKLPAELLTPSVDHKVLMRTEGGLVVSLDETPETGGITIETPNGQKILLKDDPGSVEVMDTNGNSFKLGPGGITLNAAAKVTVTASVVELSAGMVTVNAGMAHFSGVVQADTLIANNVISATYTPGAGNIM